MDDCRGGRCGSRLVLFSPRRLTASSTTTSIISTNQTTGLVDSVGLAGSADSLRMDDDSDGSDSSTCLLGYLRVSTPLYDLSKYV